MSMDWNDQGMLCGIGGDWPGREEQKEKGKHKEVVGKGLLYIQYTNGNDLFRMRGVAE